MSSGIPLDYVTPATSRRRFTRAEAILAGLAILLLAIDVFLHAFPAVYGSVRSHLPDRAGEWAQSALVYAPWVATGFSVVTILASLYRPSSAMRLTRAVALALMVYHWAFAAFGIRMYGILLWGRC